MHQKTKVSEISLNERILLFLLSSVIGGVLLLIDITLNYLFIHESDFISFLFSELQIPNLIWRRWWILLFPIMGIILPQFIKKRRSEIFLRDARLTDLLENSNDVIIFTNEKHELLKVNSQFYQILGYSEEDLSSLKLEHFFIDPIDLASITSQEYMWLTTDKKELVMEVISNHSHNIDERIIIARDVTDTKQMNQSLQDTKEQLLHSQKMEIVGRFVNSVIHDFNNLLQIISSHLELIKFEQQTENKNIGAVEEAIRISTELINQLLQFSKSNKQLNREIVNVNKLIEETRYLISNFDNRNIEIIFDVNLQPVFINANPGQINQILLNLIVNAFDAMPNGGTIKIASRHEYIPAESTDYVLIIVSDTGYGMDQITKDNLFEPFYTTKPHGTGLGLFTVSSIVEQNNGRIIVESNQGQGTTFKVYLPAAMI